VGLPLQGQTFCKAKEKGSRARVATKLLPIRDYIPEMRFRKEHLFEQISTF
jgi:hypothetical protein